MILYQIKQLPNKKSISRCTLILTLFMVCHVFQGNAQACDCNIDQVINNSVAPCDFTIGFVVNVGTEGELWDAINMANSMGGDVTILIADGIYQIASTASFPYITASNVIFRSASGNRDAVVIRGGGMQETSSTEDGFLIAGDNVVIADLTIRDVGNHGIQVSGHNLYVHNVKIQDTYEQMIKGSTVNASIDNATIQCSLFEYTAGIGPNWYIGGLDIHKGNSWTVRDNVFRDIISPSFAVAEHAIHFWDDSKDNLVERNLIVNCDRGIGFGLGDNGPQNQGGMIKNNMIYNDGEGLFNDVGIGLETSPGTKVYNNTVVVEYPNAIEYRFESTNDVDIVNNLTNKEIRSRNGGVANVVTNMTEAEESWFVDVSTGDLHLLTEQSSVLNQGSSLAEVQLDFNQNPRPSGGTHDIGAQEFQISNTLSSIDDVDIRAMPNPTTGHSTLMWNHELNNGRLQVVNSLGQLMLVKNGLIGKQYSLNLESLDTGMYFVQLMEGHKSIAALSIFLLP